MYGYGGSGCCDPCGFGGNAGYGYAAPVSGGCNRGSGKGFALIVVLFILLIIVGASRFGSA